MGTTFLGADLPDTTVAWLALLVLEIAAVAGFAEMLGRFLEVHAPKLPDEVRAKTYVQLIRSYELPAVLLIWGIPLCVAYPLPATPIFVVVLTVFVISWRLMAAGSSR